MLYGKLELDSIHGKVVMQNQCIELSDLSMRSMAADVKTTMLYKASGKRKRTLVLICEWMILMWEH